MFAKKRWFVVAVLVPAALALGPSAGRAQFNPILPRRPPQAQPPLNTNTPLIGSPHPSATVLSHIQPQANGVPVMPQGAPLGPSLTPFQQQQQLAAQQLNALTQQPLTPFQQQAGLQLLSNGLQQQNFLQQLNLLQQQNTLQQPNPLVQPNPLQPNPLAQPNPLLQPNFFQQPNLFQQPNPFQQLNPFQQP
jgi:hypothetical protein